MVTKGRMGLSSPFAVTVSATVWMRTKAAKIGRTVPKFSFRRLWKKLRDLAKEEIRCQEDYTERTKWSGRNLSRDKASNSKTWINEAPPPTKHQPPNSVQRTAPWLEGSRSCAIPKATSTEGVAVRRPLRRTALYLGITCTPPWCVAASAKAKEAPNKWFIIKFFLPGSHSSLSGLCCQAPWSCSSSLLKMELWFHPNRMRP